jgi:hypothetical protein
MAANRLAQGGHFWGRYISRSNSSTGSKQWLILDYGQIAGTETGSASHVDKNAASKSLSSPHPKQTIRAPIKARGGLLWVVEQLQGLTHYADQTHMLLNMGFWISNGQPYYQVLCLLHLISLHFATIRLKYITVK